MDPTPTTQPRHALRWVLGGGLAFVVVIAMALQVARARADERWESVLSHCEEEGLDAAVSRFSGPFLSIETFSETRGGNIVRGWRQGKWGSAIVVLRQERNFFGSGIEARMSGAGFDLNQIVPPIFASVDVELVVETRWPKNGQLASRAEWAGGVIHGHVTKWYSSGQVSFEADYVEGVLQDDTLQRWTRDGTERASE